MRVLPLIVMILSLYSCDSSQKKGFDNTSDSSKVYRLKILGDWLLHEELIECNVCPRIKILQNNTAVITLPSDDKENYNWYLKNDTLKIFSIGSDSGKYISNGEYKIAFKKEKEYLELILSMSNKVLYMLGK